MSVTDDGLWFSQHAETCCTDSGVGRQQRAAVSAGLSWRRQSSATWTRPAVRQTVIPRSIQPAFLTAATLWVPAASRRWCKLYCFHIWCCGFVLGFDLSNGQTDKHTNRPNQKHNLFAFGGGIIPGQCLWCCHDDLESLREFTRFTQWMQSSTSWLPTFGPSRWSWAISPLIGS